MNFVLAADPLLDYASRGGIIGLLIIILWGSLKDTPWWVTGREYRDLQSRHQTLRQEKDNWMNMALRAVGLAEKTVFDHTGGKEKEG